MGGSDRGMDGGLRRGSSIIVSFVDDAEHSIVRPRRVVFWKSEQGLTLGDVLVINKLQD